MLLTQLLTGNGGTASRFVAECEFRQLTLVSDWQHCRTKGTSRRWSLRRFTEPIICNEQSLGSAVRQTTFRKILGAAFMPELECVRQSHSIQWRTIRVGHEWCLPPHARWFGRAFMGQQVGLAYRCQGFLAWLRPIVRGEKICLSCDGSGRMITFCLMCSLRF